MAKLLMKLGADSAIRDLSHQARPVDWAAYNQQNEVAEYLKTLEPSHQS